MKLQLRIASQERMTKHHHGAAEGLGVLTFGE